MTEGEQILKEILARMDESQRLLREIVRWSRFQNIGRLKEVLTTELNSDEKRLAFENTDGEKGIKDVAQACRAPQDTVYSWWKKWFRLGILEPSESREGRLVKICSLEDVGIKVLKTVHSKEKAKTSSITSTEEVAENKPADIKLNEGEKFPEEVQK